MKCRRFYPDWQNGQTTGSGVSGLQRKGRYAAAPKEVSIRGRVRTKLFLKWAYLLYCARRLFALIGFSRHKASEAKAAQPAVRPVIVAK